MEPAFVKTKAGCLSMFRMSMNFCIPLIFALFLCSLPFTAVAGTDAGLSYRQNKIVYQAQKALEVGDARQCTEIIRQYLDENGSAPYPFYSLLGTCHYRLEDYPSAILAFGKAVALEPDNAELSFSLATCLYLDSRYSAAAQRFVTTYQISPDKDPDLLYQAAVAFYTAEDFRQAETVLRELLTATRDHATAWNELLLSCLLELKEWSAAEKHLQQLLRQQPEHEPYWRLMTQLHLQQKKYRQAAYALEVINRLHPPAHDELKTLAELYNYLNVPLRAAALLEQAYGTERTPDQVAEIAGLYQRGYDYAKAGAIVKEGLIRWPESSALKTLSAQLLYQQGHYRDLLHPEDRGSEATAEQNLLKGYAAWHLGKWHEARKYFRQSLGDSQYRSQSRQAIDLLNLLLEAETEAPDDQQSVARIQP